jgi:ferredoxin-NADP reductase
VPAFDTAFLASEALAEATAAFHFAKPAGFTFLPGQSMNVTLVNAPETDSRGHTRTFSIASAPFEATLEIATRLRDTAFKRVLASLPAGAPVKIRGPGGKFTLPQEADRPVVFLAGGIGITPFISMLRQAAHDGSGRRRVLVHSNGRPEDAPYLDELQAMQSGGKGFRLVTTMTQMERSTREWDGERGMVDANLLGRHAIAADGSVFYIAGPPRMIADLKSMLLAAGVNEADIRTDEFFGY